MYIGSILKNQKVGRRKLYCLKNRDVNSKHGFSLIIAYIAIKNMCIYVYIHTHMHGCEVLRLCMCLLVCASGCLSMNTFVALPESAWERM